MTVEQAREILADIEIDSNVPETQATITEALRVIIQAALTAPGGDE